MSKACRFIFIIRDAVSISSLAEYCSLILPTSCWSGFPYWENHKIYGRIEIYLLLRFFILYHPILWTSREGTTISLARWSIILAINLFISIDWFESFCFNWSMKMMPEYHNFSLHEKIEQLLPPDCMCSNDSTVSILWFLQNLIR